jgi:hypothetical protein
MIRIDTILKHVKTRNENMMKYSKILANGRKKVDNDKVIPWIASSKSSDQKYSQFASYNIAISQYGEMYQISTRQV